MRGKLKKIASESSLMNIRIRHSSLGTIKFNLYEELIVNEQVVNRELSEQPSAFAYLGILHKKLIRMVKSTEMEAEKAFSKAYIKYKDNVNPNTGRVFDKETAKEKAKLDPEYTSLIKKLVELEHDRDIIQVCLNSFEQRAHMIQSISANNRKISI